jgi:hypothetical protein
LLVNFSLVVQAVLLAVGCLIYILLPAYYSVFSITDTTQTLGCCACDGEVPANQAHHGLGGDWAAP